MQRSTEQVEESPFEDVSAERLAQVLVDSFHVEQFTTIGPFIQPERHVPHYRNEQERIFQHYLAIAMIKVGEQVVARGEADGQWFLFQLTPEPPSPGRQQVRSVFSHAEAQHNRDFFAYIEHLEAEIERKNQAISELEERVRQREAELVEARAPKLPWKRR